MAGKTEWSELGTLSSRFSVSTDNTSSTDDTGNTSDTGSAGDSGVSPSTSNTDKTSNTSNTRTARRTCTLRVDGQAIDHLHETVDDLYFSNRGRVMKADIIAAIWRVGIDHISEVRADLGIE